jgi:hypothetical protein
VHMAKKPRVPDAVIVDAVWRGLTRHQAAEHLGVPPEYLERRAKKIKVSFVPAETLRRWQVVSLYRSDPLTTAARIARLTGFNNHSVARYLRRSLGKDWNAAPKRHPQADRAIELRQSGERIQAIAQALALTPQTVSSILRQEAMIIGRGDISRIRISAVRDAHPGWNARQIAEHLGLTPSAVRKHLPRMPPPPSDLIADSGLPARVSDTLQRHGISRRSDLPRWTVESLQDIRGIGSRSLKMILVMRDGQHCRWCAPAEHRFRL